ncbi:MAG: hypothetical protein ED554_06750 [Synechococcus sp. YX04-3]|nr:MAG: hypothetical protein ED554_06750 [Synechococcus sp. YX04-3]
MIAGMIHQWAATIERLAELDRSQAFAELDVALKALPGDVPDGHRAAVAHWRGKVTLFNDAIAEAIPQLALAASPESERDATIYCLVRHSCASSSGLMRETASSGLCCCNRF